MARKPAQTQARRDWILEKTRESPGKGIAFDEVQKYFTVGVSALYADGEYFKRKGLPVDIVNGEFRSSKAAKGKFAGRKETSKEQKKEIGALAARLLCCDGIAE